MDAAVPAAGCPARLGWAATVERHGVAHNRLGPRSSICRDPCPGGLRSLVLPALGCWLLTVPVRQLARRTRAQRRLTRRRAGRRGTIPLLLEEQGAIMTNPSINTVTFFEGEPPVEWLRSRIDMLLVEHPWLAGRLTGQLGQAELHVDDPGPADDYLLQVESPELQPGLSLEETKEVVSPYLIKSGVECLSQDEPLFRVVLVSMSPGSFALVVSMSHVLGDGHSYYQVLGCLSEDITDFPEMDPVRRLGFPRACAMSIGSEKLAWVGSRQARLGNTFSRVCSGQRRWSVWEVDASFIDAEKKLYNPSADMDSAPTGQGATPGTPWVSTNDVLTSWFLRAGRYSYGFMRVNFRNKGLGDLASKHMGNYEAGIQFWPDEFATPLGVRRSLLDPPWFRTARTDVPGLLQSVRGRFAVATNWTSLQKEVRLPGCETQLHLPVVSDPQVEGAMIVFRPSASRLAVALGERRAAAAARKKTAREEAAGGSPLAVQIC
eukprot:TRINITY_DN65153_c0_g1_i1.p1 TRINITY_DN65153_c0_g1~~TRINITY_DN65153_c0_g1_i1.p1  ORF type:complete len:491 (+),score=70.22 TRINITY_DN65153_c0_g1_i1:67-1539(+)